MSLFIAALPVEDSIVEGLMSLELTAAAFKDGEAETELSLIFSEAPNGPTETDMSFIPATPGDDIAVVEGGRPLAFIAAL
jgi:hypothetical protein